MSTVEFYSKLSELDKALNAFAYNLTKNTLDAEDLYQETAFRAISNQEKFRPGTNFKAWLFTIMKNIFINNYRKKIKANTIIDSTENLFFLNSSKNAISNDADKNILLNELNQMINALDPSIRIPFALHFEGFKYQEISEELNLPLGTIKSRIFFARKHLKEMIKGRYGDYYTIRQKISA